VLRFTHGTVSITRPIEWGRIVKALVAEQAIDPAKVREVALSMRAEDSVFKVQERTVVRESEAQAPNQLAEPLVEQPRVTSVTFDARLANWDWDVETDGLIVEIYPISADGYLAPARGTVEIELFAPQKRVFQHAPLSGGDTLERVERWTRSLDAADFGASGARLKLPFGAVQPEFDLDWIGVGLVHVRLVVPGDGVFEDSLDGLRIRPYAPLRDRLEMNTGRRFLPTEGLGRRN
jgi:hypothetical protein